MANEKRLIDANACPALFDEEYKATRQLINQGQTHLDNLAEGFTEADRVIREMPTVDAVEVVRCKDCKQWNVHPINGRLTLGKCLKLSRVMDDTSFCSYGERRTDG